ncbi:iron-utilization periplasmic protein precursor [mine drainage metagenome]|uniref:Iron-utilization periplasmic protein n=1 Tax=mine drainage metagenome TaxID=410659 RepID=A0A1J5S1I0_9ZZZZ
METALHRLLLAIVAAIACAVLPAQAQKADESLFEYRGADRMDRIIVAAKKEGTVTVYASIAQTDMNSLVHMFETQYGIKVNVWRSGSDEVLYRAITETNAKTYKVDLIYDPVTELEALSRENILQPLNSPTFKDLQPGSVSKKQDRANVLISVFVQGYNTKALKKKDLPKSFKDLLDPKWKGKLGIEAKEASWFGATVKAMGDEAAGIKLFHDIAAKNGISMRKGHSLMKNMVIAGEVPLSLTVYTYMVDQAKRKGAPIDWFAIEPVIARANAIGVARHAPHPNAALLFYEFLLGTDAQKLFASLDYEPSNTRVESPLKNLKYTLIDPVVALDERAKWETLFDNTMMAK